MSLAITNHNELSQRLGQGLGLLLLVIVVWQTVRLLGLLLSGPELPQPILPELTRSAPVLTIVQNDWVLFGEADAVDYGVAESVQPTPLNLLLRGVVAGEGGYAIIMDENGNEGVYRVDDEISAGARVERIELRRVLMIRNGQREALELPGGSAAEMSRTPRPPPVDPSINALPTGIGIASLSSITGPISIDPSVLASQITILPVAGGGFRVRAGRDAALFTQLGFHLNDIVMAINGQPVNTQSDVQAIFTDLQLGQPIAITIKRGDRQMVLTPNLNQILGGS